MDRKREHDQFEVLKEGVLKRREIDALEADIEEMKEIFKDAPE